MKLAIIGTGVWGNKILQTANTLTNVSTVGYDINDNWKKCDFDCAVISTPAQTHYHIAKYLLAKGIHVMVEKPIANTFEQIQELCNIAVSKNCVLQSGHILLFTKTTEYIKDHMDLENLQLIQTRRCNFGSIPKHQIPLSSHLLIHDLALVDYIKSETLDAKVLTGANMLDTQFHDITLGHLRWQTFSSFHECSWFYPVKTRTVVVASHTNLIHCDDNNNTVTHKVGNYTEKLELLKEEVVELQDETSPLYRELDNFIDCVKLKNLQSKNGIDHILRVYINLNQAMI